MLNNDWQHLGEDIRDIVQGAIDSQDFDKLNQTVNSLISDTMQGLHGGFRDAGDIFGNGRIYGSPDGSATGSRRRSDGRSAYQDSQYRNRRADGSAAARQTGQQTDPTLRRSSELFANTNGAKALGGVLMGLGIAGTVIMGFQMIILLFSIVWMGSFFGSGLTLGIFALLVGGCVFAAVKGQRLIAMTKRFQRYIRGLRGKTFANIKQLAQEIRKKEDFVVKDLEKMIHKGWFVEGHLDEQKTCLMITDQIYEEYLSTSRRSEELRRQKLEEEKKAAEKGISPEVQAVLEEGNAYIKRIRQSNDAIPGEEISEKISRMELIVQRIFERVEQHPENIPDIRKLMEYYLPTTVKLLGAYEELDRQPIQGENILHSKEEIEKTLDTLNLAFENLLDGLFKDTMWDVSTDISVLQTMLAQEGLGKKDF